MKQYSNRNTNVMGITRNQKQQDPYSATAQTTLTWFSEHLCWNEHTWSGGTLINVNTVSRVKAVGFMVHQLISIKNNNKGFYYANFVKIYQRIASTQPWRLLCETKTICYSHNIKIILFWILKYISMVRSNSQFHSIVRIG